MKKQLTSVRLSHLISQQGVGSIACLENDYTGVILDTRFWFKDGIPNPQNELKNVSRIQRCLEITQRLFLPPTGSRDNKGDVNESIPAVLFPAYLQCVKCGKLDLNPWENNPHHSSMKPRCHCGGVMNQGTYCVVDNFGNLDNVNWNYLCHHPYEFYSNDKDKKERKRKKPHGEKAECYHAHHTDKLRVIFKKGRQWIKCIHCESEAKFEPQTEGLKPLKPQPWIFEKIADEPEGFKRKGEIVEINHPSVYSPVNLDGLVIPPESNNNENSQTISDILQYTDDLDGIIAAPSAFLRERRASQFARKIGMSIDEIHEAVNLYECGAIDSDVQELIGTPGQMKEEEYEALITKQSFSPSADFKTRHLTDFFMDLRENLPVELQDVSDIIKDLIRVERLRKVQVFQGFLRSQRDLNPEPNASKKTVTPEDKEKYLPQLVSPNIVGDPDWLPAINLHGEGIFVTLNPHWLRRWAFHRGIAKRINELAVHYELSESQVAVDEVTPEFVLLHTLAHLVIRELEDKCGYPASSLSERVYSSRESQMSGFLIYIAVADKSGSLGGLMEQAEPTSFLAVLDGAIKRAQWCTLDPVCSDHGGQGPDGLNRAACHGCTLVPDTSCDYGNVFLDRILIKGDKANGIPSLLEFIRENGSEQTNK